MLKIIFLFVLSPLLIFIEILEEQQKLQFWGLSVMVPKEKIYFKTTVKAVLQTLLEWESWEMDLLELLIELWRKKMNTQASYCRSEDSWVILLASIFVFGIERSQKHLFKNWG